MTCTGCTLLLNGVPVLPGFQQFVEPIVGNGTGPLGGVTNVYLGEINLFSSIHAHGACSGSGVTGSTGCTGSACLAGTWKYFITVTGTGAQPSGTTHIYSFPFNVYGNTTVTEGTTEIYNYGTWWKPDSRFPTFPGTLTALDNDYPYLECGYEIPRKINIIYQASGVLGTIAGSMPFEIECTACNTGTGHF